MLEAMVTWVDRQWLTDILSNHRLTTYFQPIVHFGSLNEVYGYECLLRNYKANENIISPYRLYVAARATEMFPNLDDEARYTVLETITWKDTNARIFVHINPRSIDGPRSCLGLTVNRANHLGNALDQIIFRSRGK